MTEQQAVVDEAKGAAEPAPAVDSARKDDADLDTLLSQFEQETKAADSPPETKVETVNPAVTERLKALEQRYFQEDIKKITDDVFDGLDVSDNLKRVWIEGTAITKPGVRAIFDPNKRESVIKALKLAAQKDFPNARKVEIDPEATADHNAVAAAVRGASTKVAAEPAPDFARMSNAELAQWKRDNMK